MPEYEPSRKHFSTKDRCAFLGLFIFWTVPTIGSYMAFSGDVWLSRLLTYVTVGFGLLLVASFVDARLMAIERRQRRASLVQLGTKDWFWVSDRDPWDNDAS